MNTQVTRKLRMLDVVIVLMLSILAFAFPEIIQEFFAPKMLWLHSVSITIGMLPLFFYAQHRGIVHFDRWDIVAWSPMLLILGVAPYWLRRPPAFFAAVIVVLLVCMYIRSLLPASHWRINRDRQ